jgi:predicted Rossmann fold nucleotide-binding protein DprA/Smf involved in DNA uptake
VSVVASRSNDETSVEIDTPYWVAFRGITGVGPVRTQRLLQHFGSLQSAWEADVTTLRTMLEARVVEQIVSNGAQVILWAYLNACTAKTSRSSR